MPFFIVQVSGSEDQPVRSTLAGDYGEKQHAEEAVRKLLIAYASHGHNDEQGYWWARDDKGRRFKFVVSSS